MSQPSTPSNLNLYTLLFISFAVAAAAACCAQGAKIFGDGVWFKTNAAALTDEGANILGLGFGLGNNIPFLFVSTVSKLQGWRILPCGRCGGREGY
jgi:hypothetical protein